MGYRGVWSIAIRGVSRLVRLRAIKEGQNLDYTRGGGTVSVYNVYWTPRGGGGGCGRGTLPYSSVASFFGMGGGGGQAPQMYRQKKTIMYMSPICASASETYNHIFSGLKMHLHRPT